MNEEKQNQKEEPPKENHIENRMEDPTEIPFFNETKPKNENKFQVIKDYRSVKTKAPTVIPLKDRETALFGGVKVSICRNLGIADQNHQWVQVEYMEGELTQNRIPVSTSKLQYT